MSNETRASRGLRRRTLSGLAVGVVLLAAACSSGHSPQAKATPVPSPTSTGVARGVFGDLGRICGPGTPSASKERGVTDSTIRVGTMADPGAALTPGLEQEYFDVALAFTKWCNAAGGINGRRILLDRYDAKLFDGAARILDACQRDFMLVGNGNALDAPDVRPRLACKLGEIPALSISPEAVKAGLQVQATVSNVPGVYAVGPLKALLAAYPFADPKLAIGSSNLASLSPQGVYAKQAYASIGVKIAAVQEKPGLVTNFRPYMEQLRLAGATAYTELAAVDPGPEVTAMNDVGWHPSFALWGIQFYDPKSVAAARAIAFPPSYVALGALPAELVDDFPVLQQIRAIMTGAIKNPRYTSFTGLAISAWTLWAKSATDCGAHLTQSCVLAKAGSHSKWTSGGFFPPHSTVPGHETQSPCFLLMKLTPSGFVYDRKATAPTSGPFNCRAGNIVAVSPH
jgi:hypothetical protein